VTSPPPLERVLPWALRATWVAVAVTGAGVVDRVLDGAGVDPTGATALRWAAGLAWVAVVAALAVPAPSTLTAVRAGVPLAAVTAILCAISGGATVGAILFTGTAGLATVIALAAPIGSAFVQASAYGDEERFLLRPPLAFLVAATTAWAMWAAVVVVATIATARGAWIVAAVAALIVVLGGWQAGVRWHRLSRRWLVLVPAGLVVHDHLALAETLMIRRQAVALMGLAPAGTDAADLTGPAAGHALEIRTAETVTAIVGVQPGRAPGSPIHLTGCLVAPSRPGRVLRAAAARRFPVGAVD
jgi:hypothetical protein